MNESGGGAESYSGLFGLLRSSAAYGMARGIPGIVSLLALATYTRILTKEQYGTYALVVAAAGFTYAVAFQWLSLGVLRLVKGGGWSREVFLATVAQCLAAALLLVAGVAGGLIAVHRLAGPGLILIGFLLVAAQAWLEVNVALAIAESDPIRYAKLSGARSVIALGLGVALGWAGFGAHGVLLGVVTGYAVAGVWGATRWWGGVHWGDASADARRKLFAYGFPLTLTYLLDFVVSTSDRVLLGAMRGPEAAGTYAAAYDLCQQSIWALMVILTQSAYPLVVDAFERGGAAGARGPLRRHGLLLAAIAMPATIGLAVLAPSITRVILPPSYGAETRMIVPLVAFGVLLGGLKAYYFDFSFQLGHRTQRQLAAVFLAAVTNLGLNLLWIPRFGLLGAAYATLVAYGVGVMASWVLGRAIMSIPIPGREFLKIVSASVGMGIVLWPLREYSGKLALTGQLILGISAYFALVLATDLGGGRTAVRSLARQMFGRLR